ncbi:MAG: hypothetical protein QOI10_1325 [Solirubrobacterales bacterium]|nr:hypothetical protein [Solirubrobacterales bacterium]
MRRRTVATVTLALTLTGALAAAGPAQATFPGTNGIIAYIGTSPSASSEVFTLDPKLSPPVTQQITTQGSFVSVNFDSTGLRLVAETNAAGLDGIVFLDPKPGTAVTPLTGGDVDDRRPGFDPTGTKIAFDNGGDIFVQNVDGTGRTNLTTGTADILIAADWSPDGQFIAFEDNTDEQIKKINVADGTITTVTPPAAGCSASATCDEPSFGPNGTHIAYDQDGVPRGIYDVLASGATSVTRLSIGNDDLAAYAPQGDRVAFQNFTSDMATVPTDGSQVESPVTAVPVGRMSWGIKPVPPAPPPSNVFTFGALTRNLDKGTANQTVTVPGPGELTLSGGGIAAQRLGAKIAIGKPVAAAGDVVVKIKATGSKKTKLKKKGKVNVNASFTFTPNGGTANTLTKKIKLKRN